MSDTQLCAEVAVLASKDGLCIHGTSAVSRNAVQRPVQEESVPSHLTNCWPAPCALRADTHWAPCLLPCRLQTACVQAFARAPPSDKQPHDQPWERARQRADALLNKHYQQKALQPPGADADVADDEAEKFHRGDTAVAAAEGNVVQLGLQNIRLEVVEELSDAEEELYASDPQGEGGRGWGCKWLR